ncbi:PAS domain S-box protein, partial [candidate division KSB1 bacterium]
MKNSVKMQEDYNSLRERARGILQKNPGYVDDISSKGIEDLIEELYIHQIELEMQNEELRRSQMELEESRSRYTDLYDFAPVGYFTVDNNGIILEANLTGADLLGIERGTLIKKPFSIFVEKEYQDIFFQNRRLVSQTGRKQTCEILLKNMKKDLIWVRVDSVEAKNEETGNSCIRTAVSDITQKIEAELSLDTERLK